MESDNVILFVPKLELERQGHKVLTTLQNVKKMLDGYKITSRLNIINRQIEVTIPGYKLSNYGKLNSWDGVIISLLIQHGLSPEHRMSYLQTLADANQYNPVAEWVDSLPWDGESRLANFYETIKSDNEKLKETILKKWLVMAVAALYESDGIEPTGIMVLQGAQGLGKTRWFKHLVPEALRRYVKDGISLDLDDKDSVNIATSCWLVELGELPDTIRRCGVNALKAFISRKTDTWRSVYARTPSEFPRRTVFCGTVNDEQFLRDETGNRRFFTIACEKIDYEHAVDMQQVWAEVKVLWENGETFVFGEEEQADMNDYNEEHEYPNPIREKIIRSFDFEDPEYALTVNQWLFATEVLEKSGLPKADSNMARKAGLVLKKLTGGRSKKNPPRQGLGDAALHCT